MELTTPAFVDDAEGGGLDGRRRPGELIVEDDREAAGAGGGMRSACPRRWSITELVLDQHRHPGDVRWLLLRQDVDLEMGIERGGDGDGVRGLARARRTDDVDRDVGLDRDGKHVDDVLLVHR